MRAYGLNRFFNAVRKRMLTTSIAAAALSTLCACGGGASSSASSFVPANASQNQQISPTTALGLGSPSEWSDGQRVPADFLNSAFGASGPLYQQLPANPTIDSNSSKVISYYFSGNPRFNAGFIDANSGQAQYDYSFPIYKASAIDPQVRISCSHAAAASCVDNNTLIYMPALARQAGGADHHLAVIQPNGIEYDFWLVDSQPPYSNGSKFSAAGEAHFALDGTPGTGYVSAGFAAGGATSGGIALSVGQVYTSEFAQGSIKHALSLTFACGTNSWVYPAMQSSGSCPNGQGMPLGSRLWWQPDDASTNTMALAPDMKKIMIALHHYGGFYTDNFGGSGTGSGMGAHLENQEAYWIYGNGVDPARDYAAAAPGWSHVIGGGVDRYVLAADGNASNFLNNLKVLAPCVTQGAC